MAEVNGHRVSTRAGKLTLAEVLLELAVKGELVIEVRDEPVPINSVRVELERPDVIVLGVYSTRREVPGGEA